jgi:hypothetical protein
VYHDLTISKPSPMTSPASGRGPILGAWNGQLGLRRQLSPAAASPDQFFLHPEAIAESVLALVRQSRQAWTFELDLRPFGEKW